MTTVQVQLFGIIWGESCNFELNKKWEGNMKSRVGVGKTLGIMLVLIRILEVVEKRKGFWGECFYSKYRFLLIFFYVLRVSF